jgi:hypothetical protein
MTGAENPAIRTTDIAAFFFFYETIPELPLPQRRLDPGSFSCARFSRLGEADAGRSLQTII